MYWTLEAFDGMIVCESPDEATPTAIQLPLGSLFNLRTQTVRNFDAAELQGFSACFPVSRWSASVHGPVARS
jgi:uncharacterized protein with GYD domain